MHDTGNQITRIIRFLKSDIWRINLKTRTGKEAFLIRQLRIFLLAGRKYHEDQCLFRASALTHYTLLSIVPMAALAFGIAKGFGLEKPLLAQLMDAFPGQEVAMTWVVDFANSMLKNTKGGMIAGVGFVLLLWMVIKLISNIESAFNEIWQIKTARNFGRKVSDYFAIVMICLVLVIVSGSIFVFITTQIKQITAQITLLGAMSPVIFFLLKFLPFSLIWLLFSILFIAIPNTRINFTTGILAGILTGTLYGLVQWAYIHFQISVTRFNAIYGSFAALPLFLIWLEWSWIIVLFGAQVAYAYQNIDRYENEPDCRNISFALKKKMSIGIVKLIVTRFAKDHPPVTENEIASELGLPIYITRKLLDELTELRIISRLTLPESKATGYQPAYDIAHLTAEKVIYALEQKGNNQIPFTAKDTLNGIDHLFKPPGSSDQPPATLLKDL